MGIETLYNIFGNSTGVCTDTRRIEAGKLFFALHGENFDGNAFATQALEQGAIAAVVESSRWTGSRDDRRFIVVDDVLRTLQLLAAEHRRRLAIPILGIVGSNGKTTTKELTTRVLAEKFATSATTGNLNNHIGVPLTLLEMNHETEFGVVEMGASSCGEIAMLCSISQPNYGIITNIGRAHLDGFGGPEGVRRGKGELFDFLNENGGHAFVPAEDPILVSMAHERPDMAVEMYSRSIADGMESSLSGAYNHNNIASAVAVGRYFGIDVERIREAIGSYRPTNNRSQETSTERNRLIIDCYNANPSSMESSIGNLVDHEAGHKTLILGDMLELGEWSHDEHCRILELALATNPDAILTVGREFGAACSHIDKDPRIHSFISTDELKAWLEANPISGSLILVKGSRGIALERILNLL